MAESKIQSCTLTLLYGESTHADYAHLSLKSIKAVYFL